MRNRIMRAGALLGLALALCAPMAAADALDGAAPALRAAIEHAVDRVKPGLVRIHVVDTFYREGRELKFESSGSGVVISPDGHIITNHHVAGHAKQLKCTFADKSEFSAEIVGTDPLTDIAVIRVTGAEGRVFTPVPFGDSDGIRVGDHVLAMGSPLALSQSVTLGIVSNTQMIMPDWISRFGGLEQDGEDVGALVRWIGHDAEIFGGNSGGPLVNLRGEIIGINEIKMGLGGAIPGNLAREVAEALMAEGKIRRAWLGIEVQPRLKHDPRTRGILVSGVLRDAPAAEAGLRSGDLLTAVGPHPVDVAFAEQLPDFNRLVAGLEVDAAIPLLVEREGREITLRATPREREPRQPRQTEIRQWGITVRDISNLMAKEMKRDSADGVLVTSVRPGGPAGDAKPPIRPNDILMQVGGAPVESVERLREVTAELTRGAASPVPALTKFERERQQYLTAVRVGLSELEDPGLEVRKAWLPVETQVLTREIAELLDRADLSGFRITHVYGGSTAEAAGLRPGDMILAVDGERMTASNPEDFEELSAWIRQYRPGDTAELRLLRDGEITNVEVELVQSPQLPREMRKHRDDSFEFTVREVTFFDRAKEQWEDDKRGVLVEDVRPGGWAALGNLSVGDLLQTVNGEPADSVDALASVLAAITEEQPRAVVFQVLRGIRTIFIELEPMWDGVQGAAPTNEPGDA